KCLEKEPGKRYRSAQEMAEDLERFLAGEPIVARPVGVVERSWRWCKRNPALAVSLTAVAAALLIGSVVSVFFAIRAGHNADLAQARAADALSEEAKARQAEQRATDKEAETNRLLDHTKRMLMTTQLLNVAAIYQKNPIQALR